MYFAVGITAKDQGGGGKKNLKTLYSVHNCRVTMYMYVQYKACIVIKYTSHTTQTAFIVVSCFCFLNELESIRRYLTCCVSYRPCHHHY